MTTNDIDIDIDILVNNIQDIKLEENEKMNPDTILCILEHDFKTCDLKTLICYKYWIKSKQHTITKNIMEIKYLYFKLNNIVKLNINEFKFNMDNTSKLSVYNLITVNDFSYYNNNMKKIYTIICSKFNDSMSQESSDGTESYDSSIYNESESESEEND